MKQKFKEALALYFRGILTMTAWSPVLAASLFILGFIGHALWHALSGGWEIYARIVTLF